LKSSRKNNDSQVAITSTVRFIAVAVLTFSLVFASIETFGNGGFSSSSSILSSANPPEQRAYALTGSQCMDNLTIVQISASSGSGNPKKVIDNDLTTSWSNYGTPASISLDLGSIHPVCHVDIAWFKGDERNNYFTLSVSNSTSGTFLKIYSGMSSGKSTNFERYDFTQESARYVKISVTKNQISAWVSINEVHVYGIGTVLPTVPSSKTLDALMEQSYGNQQELSDFYKLHMKSTDMSRSKPTDSNFQYTMQLPGQHGVSYFSLAEIKANAAPLKAKGASFIEYDLESNYSPSSDLADPVASIKAAYNTAHASGLKLAVNPSKALTRDFGVQFAPYADYYNFMFQALQDDCSAYGQMVKDMATKIRIVNPNVKISIEVSTGRGSIDSMKQCYAAGAPYAEGVSIWYSVDDVGMTQLKSFVEWFDTNYR
jgi:hypothetical protein